MHKMPRKTHVTTRQNKNTQQPGVDRMCDHGYSFTIHEKPVISRCHITRWRENNFSIGKLILSIARSFNHNEN